MCYCLKLQHPEKYIFSAILEGYHNALTQIGEEIDAILDPLLSRQFINQLDATDIAAWRDSCYSPRQ